MKKSVPSREECFSLMEEHGMWDNIVRHSVLVEKVARRLAEVLIAGGEKIDLAEVTAAALLHDITKTRSIQTRENHALTGQELLIALGYPRIGEIVRYHVLMPPAITIRSSINVAEVVHYADKRVLHDTLVTLPERFEDLIIRYGKTINARSKLKRLKDQSFLMEKKIFSKIQFEPEQLAAIVEE